jgi:hypothetical protein
MSPIALQRLKCLGWGRTFSKEISSQSISWGNILWWFFDFSFSHIRNDIKVQYVQSWKRRLFANKMQDRLSECSVMGWGIYSKKNWSQILKELLQLYHLFSKRSCCNLFTFCWRQSHGHLLVAMLKYWLTSKHENVTQCGVSCIGITGPICASITLKS